MVWRILVQPLELCGSDYRRNQHPLSWKSPRIGQRSGLSLWLHTADSGLWGTPAPEAAALWEAIRSRDSCPVLGLPAAFVPAPATRQQNIGLSV